MDKTAEEILDSIIPNGCINLSSYRVERDKIVLCMEEYASTLKKRIEELEEGLVTCSKIMLRLGYPMTSKMIEELLHPSTNGK